MGLHNQFHTKFGFCLWDAIALLVLAAMVAVLVIHNVRQKKRERDFEGELSEKLARESVQEDD